MNIQKIVVKFQDGSLMKGESTDFLPEKKYFYLKRLEGGTKKIDVETLKAVFFCQGFCGEQRP